MNPVEDRQRWALSHVAPDLSARHEIETVRLLLDRAAGLPIESRSVTTSTFAKLREHRVATLIPRDWDVDDHLAVSRHRREVAGIQFALDNAAAAALEVLEGAGIETRMLKGLATGPLDYAARHLRHAGDIDLLIHLDELPRAMDLIGGTRTEASEADIRFLKGPTILDKNGLEIDLHYRLSRYCEPSSELLFANPVAIPNSSGLALPVELRLIHAAAHLIFSRPGRRRLSGVADISAIRSHHDLDLDRVRSTAQELGLARVAGFGLRLERLARHLEDDLGDWPAPSRLEKLAYARADPAVPMEHVLDFSTLQSWRDRGGYLAYRLGTAVGRITR